MTQKQKIICIALLLHSTNTFSNAVQLKGDTEYRQALPHLIQITKITKAIDERRASGLPPKESAKPYLNELRDNIRNSASLLNQASQLQHPVAQYRLAQIISLYGNQQEKHSICELLEASLRQGFVPAAIEAAALCPSFSSTPEFLSYAEASARSAKYSEYFPQPSHFLSHCERPKARTLNAKDGSEIEYQAAIYYILGSNAEKSKRSDYFKLATEKGCSRAHNKI